MYLSMCCKCIYMSHFQECSQVHNKTCYVTPSVPASCQQLPARATCSATASSHVKLSVPASCQQPPARATCSTAASSQSEFEYVEKYPTKLSCKTQFNTLLI